MKIDKIDRERKRKRDWYNKCYEISMYFRKYVLVGKKMYNVKDDVKKKMLEKYRNCFENKYKIDEEYRDKIL